MKPSADPFLLWIKARQITEGKSFNIVYMLRGFYLLMKFLRSIGPVMIGSGLEEAMEQVYPRILVPHIIFGKTVSKTLQAHFVVESVLVNKLKAPLRNRRDTEEEDRKANIEVDQ